MRKEGPHRKVWARFCRQSIGEMMDEEVYTERHWVYQGRVWSEGVRHVWAPSDDVDKSMYFGGKDAKRSVGGVYTIQAWSKPNGGTTAKFGTLQYQHQHPNRELVAQWQAQDIATGVRISAQRMERKAGEMEELRERIEPLRNLYLNLRTRHDKDAFMAAVSRAIQLGW